jgi:hypothetical protein
LQKLAEERLELHAGGRRFARPDVEKLEKILELLERDRNDVVVEVKVNAQTNELGTGRRKMTGSDAGFDTEMKQQFEELVPQELAEMFGTNGHEVVHIISHIVVTTQTGTGAVTGKARVLGARSRRNPGPEQPADGVGHPLGGHHGTSVTEGVHPVDVKKTVHNDGQKWRLAWVNPQKPEITEQVHLKADEVTAGVLESNPLDERDNGVDCG